MAKPHNPLVTFGYDADYLVHHAAAANEHATVWEDGIVTKWGNLNAAKQTFMDTLHRIEKEMLPAGIPKPAERYFYFSSSTNFRKAILPTYKAGRKEKPLLHAPLKAWVKETFAWNEYEGYEADDLLGIAATEHAAAIGDSSTHGMPKFYIVSPDKDFKTIPGHFLQLKPFTNSIEYHKISQDAAERYYWGQVLSGDATDGYSGCPGFGTTKAEEWVKEPWGLIKSSKVLKSGPRKGQTVDTWEKCVDMAGTYQDMVRSIYRAAGADDDFVVQATVARILTIHRS